MRKKASKKRVLLPDPKFNDTMVTRFVNNLMVEGKKNVAFKVFYNSIELVGKKMEGKAELSPLDVWKEALQNITPQVEVRSRRIGGSTFQVPSEIRPERKMSVGMKNMINFATKRVGKAMELRLAEEIVAAFNKEGGAYKRKEEIHRMADANRAFAFFKF